MPNHVSILSDASQRIREHAIVAQKPIPASHGRISLPYDGPDHPGVVALPLDLTTGLLRLRDGDVARLRHDATAMLRAIVDLLNTEPRPLAPLLARPVDAFYRVLALDRQRHGAMAVWGKLAAAHWLTRLLGPGCPFSFPHTPVMLSDVRYYDPSDYQCVVTTQCGPHFIYVDWCHC